MQQVRVAILGQGRSGHDIHAFTVSQMTDKFKIVAVVDDLASRRERAEREYGCAAYEDYQQLFGRDDIDLVINALPSAFHVPVSLEFLNAGFHVLSEKPLARRVKDADAVIEAARANNRVFAVYQQSRFSPAFMKVKEVMDSGVLGRIVQANISFSGFARRWDWQTLKAMNGGNLLNTGPHPVDQALQIFGTDIMPRVICHMDSANSSGDAEDYVKLILMGDEHPLVDVEISSCEAYSPFVYHLQGTRGGLTGNLTHLDWKYFRPEEAPVQSLINEPLQTDDGSPAYCSESLTWHQESWDIDAQQGKNLFLTMSKSYYSMLHDALSNGQPLKVTLDEVRQQVAVMEEAFRQNPKFDI